MGFQPAMTLHIAIAAVFLVTTLLRNKLGHQVKSYAVVICIFIAGASGLINFGLSGAGTLALLGAVIFARLLLSTRVALVIICSSIFLMIFQFYLAYSGRLTFSAISPGYVLTPSAWTNNITGFAFIGLVALYVIDNFFEHLMKISSQLEQQLEQGRVERERSELVLSTILNSLKFGVAWKDKDLRFLGGNQYFVDDSGKNSLGDIIGKTDFELHRSDVAKRFRAMDQQVINTKQPTLDAIEHIQLAGGGERYIIVNCIPLLNRSSEVTGVVVYYADITDTKLLEIELRNAKAEAEDASRAKSEFLATMSHEIRTPINGVMGLLELTLATELDDRQREYLNKAELSANTLLQIINQILDISKIEAGKMDIEHVPFVPNNILTQVEQQLAHMAKHKKLQFEVNGRGALASKVIGDPTKLLQIIINLCSNAIKFTDEGSVTLTMGALTDKNNNQIKLRIEVADTGIGIPLEMQKKLFASFTQADSSTSRKFGGTGLGLAIVKQMLELQGGSIELVSEPSKGSTFTCYINYDIYEGTTYEAVPNRRQTLEGIRVLLVEDNHINRLIAQEMLMLEQAAVVVAENGIHALEQLAEHEVDVILMDIQMPKMDGKAATKMIRENLQWQSLPIIALTANVLAHDVEEYYKLGFSFHLGKPFQKEQLVAAIHHALTLDE